MFCQRIAIAAAIIATPGAATVDSTTSPDCLCGTGVVFFDTKHVSGWAADKYCGSEYEKYCPGGPWSARTEDVAELKLQCCGQLRGESDPKADGETQVTDSVGTFRSLAKKKSRRSGNTKGKNSRTKGSKKRSGKSRKSRTSKEPKAGKKKPAPRRRRKRRQSRDRPTSSGKSSKGGKTKVPARNYKECDACWENMGKSCGMMQYLMQMDAVSPADGWRWYGYLCYGICVAAAGEDEFKTFVESGCEQHEKEPCDACTWFWDSYIWDEYGGGFGCDIMRRERIENGECYKHCTTEPEHDKHAIDAFLDSGCQEDHDESHYDEIGSVCAGGFVDRSMTFFDEEGQLNSCGDAADYCNMHMDMCGGSERVNDFFWYSTNCCMSEEGAQERTNLECQMIDPAMVYEYDAEDGERTTCRDVVDKALTPRDWDKAQYEWDKISYTCCMGGGGAPNKECKDHEEWCESIAQLRSSQPNYPCEEDWKESCPQTCGECADVTPVPANSSKSDPRQ